MQEWTEHDGKSWIYFGVHCTKYYLFQVKLSDPLSSSSPWQIIHPLLSTPCLIKMPPWLLLLPPLLPPDPVPRWWAVAAPQFPSPAPTRTPPTYLSLSPLVHRAREDFHLWLVRDCTVKYHTGIKQGQTIFWHYLDMKMYLFIFLYLFILKKSILG